MSDLDNNDHPNYQMSPNLLSPANHDVRDLARELEDRMKDDEEQAAPMIQKSASHHIIAPKRFAEDSQQQNLLSPTAT